MLYSRKNEQLLYRKCTKNAYNNNGRGGGVVLPPISVPFEVEPQLKYGVVELATKSVFVRVLPLSVDNLEGDVLVGRTGDEAEDLEVGLCLTRCPGVRGRLGHVNEIRVEDVELVTLNNLRWRVVQVVVGLVVLVPYEAGVHTIKESRLARTILIRP